MFWKYNTNPKHPFDYLLWSLLRPVMLLFADGKISHWWHWRNVPLPGEFQGIKLKGDHNMMGRSEDDKLSLIKVSLGGWKNCFLLRPVNYQNGWFFVFKNSETTMKRCSIELHGACRVLQGNNDGVVYGMDISGKEVPLKITGNSSRKNPQFSKTPLI